MRLCCNEKSLDYGVEFGRCKFLFGNHKFDLWALVSNMIGISGGKFVLY